ncbi:MAG: Smr/MutS family protein [Thermoleophilia bacterium]
MSERSQQLLELPGVTARLAGLAGFSGGVQLAHELTPAHDADEVHVRRAETEEAVLLEQTTAASPGGAHDVRQAVAAAAIGETLAIGDLERILVTIGVAQEVRAGVLGQAGVAPLLAERLEVGVVPAGLREPAGALERALDRRGGLLDSASPELGTLRRQVATARRDAADTLRRLAARLGAHLQERFTTERSGRPVLAVKASSRSAVPGIVHDSSASGQTIFVEPLAVLDANNRLRELEAMEAAEVRRILAELTGRVAEAAGALTMAVDALAHHDMVLARARLSVAWRGCTVEDADQVHLEGARHPLLDPARAVPVDLPLDDVHVLVVSGPNTGGKTVALKTLGLLAMLNQCGLRVPATTARLPIFSAIVADIGDEQSIAASLSTFSAHLRSLVHVLGVAGPGALVLLDEVAGGTDPEEGGPLAQALLQRLMAMGATVLATTHLGALKQWAAATPGAANAAVDIDPTTFRPRYRLLMGEPGASHALDIALDLGLDPEVVADARRAMSPEQRVSDELLRAAQRARQAAEDELRAAREAHGDAQRTAEEAQQRLRELERELADRRREAERERVLARERADAELAAATRELAELRTQVNAARRAEGSRARGASGDEARRDRALGAADQAQRRARSLLQPAVEGGGEVAVGQAVHDPTVGFRGVVVAVEGDTAEVQGERIRMRLPVARLVADPRGRPAPAPRPVERRPELRAAPAELDVRAARRGGAGHAARGRGRGRHGGPPSLRVIHGVGTGALRTAVRQELARHPLVDRADPAPPNAGGDGATFAILDASVAGAAPAPE